MAAAVAAEGSVGLISSTVEENRTAGFGVPALLGEASGFSSFAPAAKGTSRAVWSAWFARQQGPSRGTRRNAGLRVARDRTWNLGIGPKRGSRGARSGHDTSE